MDASALHLLFSLFFKKKIIYLFIFGCIGSLLLCVGFSLVAVSRGYSSLWCVGFSCCRALALGMWASVVVAWGLQ